MAAKRFWNLPEIWARQKASLRKERKRERKSWKRRNRFNFVLGATEIIIILIAAGVIVFGGKKGVGEIARSLGKFSSEFKKGRREVEEEINKIKKEIR